MLALAGVARYAHMYMQHPPAIYPSIQVRPVFMNAMEVQSCTLAEVALNYAFHRWSFGNLGVHDVVNSQPLTQAEKQPK